MKLRIPSQKIQNKTQTQNKIIFEILEQVLTQPVQSAHEANFSSDIFPIIF